MRLPPEPCDHRPDGGEEEEEEALAALEVELAAAWQRSRAAARRLAAGVHPQLDPTAYPLVAVLRRAGALRPSALGDLLHLDRSTVTRQVDAVERLGLVVRLADPGDARARLVTLTALGRERAEAVHAQRLQRWRAGLGDWPHRDVVELTRLVHLLGGLELD